MAHNRRMTATKVARHGTITQIYNFARRHGPSKLLETALISRPIELRRGDRMPDWMWEKMRGMSPDAYDRFESVCNVSDEVILNYAALRVHDYSAVQKSLSGQRNSRASLQRFICMYPGFSDVKAAENTIIESGEIVLSEFFNLDVVDKVKLIDFIIEASTKEVWFARSQFCGLGGICKRMGRMNIAREYWQKLIDVCELHNLALLAYSVAGFIYARDKDFDLTRLKEIAITGNISSSNKATHEGRKSCWEKQFPNK
jgi:hypothetical protein